MKLKRLARSIENMPRPAYIFLRAVLLVSCVMLFAAFVLFAEHEQRPADHALYRTAVLLLENPAGVLMLGLIGLGFMLDRLR